jgi:integrase
LSDVSTVSVTVNQSVWNGKEGSPKTVNAIRTVAVSPYLAKILGPQLEYQAGKGHHLLFSTSTGKPWDMNLFRRRKLQPLLRQLGIQSMGFHGFRHFNASLMNSLRVPLKTI